jgi:hypothetical protein
MIYWGELAEYLSPIAVKITPETNTIEEKIKLSLQHLFSIKTFEQPDYDLNNFLILI